MLNEWMELTEAVYMIDDGPASGARYRSRSKSAAKSSSSPSCRLQLVALPPVLSAAAHIAVRFAFLHLVSASPSSVVPAFPFPHPP